MYSHSLNLLPAKEQQRRRAEALNHYTLVGGMVAVSAAIVMAGLLLLFDQVYRSNLAGLQAQKQAAGSQAAALLDVEKEALDLEAQLANLQKANQQTTHWAALVTALRSFTPEGASIKAISFQSPQGQEAAPAGGSTGQKSLVSGTVDSRRTLGQFQLALSGSPFLKNVQIDNSTRTGKVFQYSISMEVDYQKLEGPES